MGLFRSLAKKVIGKVGGEKEPARPVSAPPARPPAPITRAPEIWSHVTGMPSHGSVEPQRPTPISRYGRPSPTSCELNRATSAAASTLRERSNR